MLQRFLEKQARSTQHSSLCTEIETYWDALLSQTLTSSNDRAALPLRRDIDPRAIRHALPHVFLLDVSKPEMARFTIVGSQIAELWQSDLRNMPLTTLFERSNRSALRSLLSDVKDMSAKAQLELQCVSDAHHFNRAKLLLLPLLNEAGEIYRLLGCFEFLDRTQEQPAPLRLQVKGAVLRPLSAQGLKPMIIKHHAQHLRLVSDTGQHTGQPRSPRRCASASNLRLVKG